MEVARVDVQSGGRMEFGVGAGWKREEMRNHGTDPRIRMALLAERIAAMKAIWAEEEASFHGKYVSFDRIWSHPKPAQRPHPPILVGGDGPTVLDRVLAFGDAWFPNYRPYLLDRVRELRAKAERPVEGQMISVPADPAVLERLHGLRVRRVMPWPPPRPRRPAERAPGPGEDA